MIAFGMPAGWEWLIVAAIALLLFGHRLPKIARSLGASITGFKRGLNETADEIGKLGDDDA